MNNKVQSPFFRFAFGSSIAERLRKAFWVLILLLLIPSLVSLATMGYYANRYHSLINRVGRVSTLKPYVQNDIPDEMWNIIAGRFSFDEGRQNELVSTVNQELDALIKTANKDNLIELAVARRTMDSLSNYIADIGGQIAAEAPVEESEKTLEEVKSVSALAADMLEKYIDTEIQEATNTSNQIQRLISIIFILLTLLFLLTLIFSAFAQRSLSQSFRAPIQELETFAHQLAGGNLELRVPPPSLNELRGLSSSLNIMASKLDDLIEANKQEQENLKKSELRTLQAQIAPHFLYNTLDAIVWLAEAQRTDEVIHVTRSISDFFRISLSQGLDWIPICEEVRHLKGYLVIQKIRYRDILDYEIDIPESLYKYQVLKLLLQPLVENAIYHGIKLRRSGGIVTITGRQKGENLIFSVHDNGVGMSEERVTLIKQSLLKNEKDSSSGFGLYNVDQRIRLYYNQPKGIEIESTSTGTTISFLVPVRSENHVKV